MKKVNIVYAYMREPRFEVAVPGRDALAVWTTTEEPDADIVIYFSGYSYEKKQATKNPKAFRILYMYEPLVVYPRQFLRRFWTPFDRVLTWNETLVEQGGKFERFPSLYYNFPFGAAHGITGDPILPTNWMEKRTALCQVAGNKHSFISSELYSKRRKIARWFGRHGTIDLDTFGVPPMPVPNYWGHAEDKQKTLAQYRFSLCLENDAHPLWSRGYVTEKIFDCFYAFTIPVYLGAADIQDHLPAECFIDLRDFVSFADLERYLKAMSDDEVHQRFCAIETFLQRYHAPQKHSCFQLYETALDLATAHTAISEKDSFGFWQKASWMEKVRCTIMLIALPVYKAIRRTRYSGT